uniref:Uncharacterized protein n=1 Tax=Romanomermis culicivorax TaxID=13658 RepID=A0A915JLH5_ROMCU
MCNAQILIVLLLDLDTARFTVHGDAGDNNYDDSFTVNRDAGDDNCHDSMIKRGALIIITPSSGTINKPHNEMTR